MSNKKRCKLPDLDAFDKSIMSAMFVPPKLTCPGQKHLSFYQDGKLRLNLLSKGNLPQWHIVILRMMRAQKLIPVPSTPFRLFCFFISITVYTLVDVETIILPFFTF